MSQLPTPGRIVMYTLSESEAEHLAEKHRADIGRTLNKPNAGDVYPAQVVRVWSGTCVNLTVQLDGEHVYWATSRAEGDQPGSWAWPTIAAPAKPNYFSADSD